MVMSVFRIPHLTFRSILLTCEGIDKHYHYHYQKGSERNNAYTRHTLLFAPTTIFVLFPTTTRTRFVTSNLRISHAIYPT